MSATITPPPVPAWYFACMHSAWDGARFGDALRRVMTEAGLDRQAVADMTGINRSQVSRWLSGANRPGFDALQRLAAGLRQRHPHREGAVAELLTAAGYPDGGIPAGPAPTAAPASIPGDDPVLEFVRGLPGLSPAQRQSLESIASVRGLDVRMRRSMVGWVLAVWEQDEAESRPA